MLSLENLSPEADIKLGKAAELLGVDLGMLLLAVRDRKMANIILKNVECEVFLIKDEDIFAEWVKNHSKTVDRVYIQAPVYMLDDFFNN